MAKNKSPQNTQLKFNFLEELFLSISRERNTQDNRIKFNIIKPDDKQQTICLLLKLDKKGTIPITEGLIPDRMVFYVDQNICICTIIELKNTRDEKQLNHGIEQIISLKDKLKDDIEEHLPMNLKVHVQGILLASIASLPTTLNSKLKKLKSNTVIRHIPYKNKQINLFPYISTKVSLI